jgi:hypothetical protein
MVGNQCSKYREIQSNTELVNIMPCGMCPKDQIRPVIADLVAKSFALRETDATKVIGVKGIEYPLHQKLVTHAHFPRGQWAVTLPFKGIDRIIDLPTAPHVFNEAFRMCQLNDEDRLIKNLWLNLNLQWVPRVAPKYQIVTLQQLEAISTPMTP